MYREMRRSDRAMSPQDTMALLERGEYGILSTVSADGQPYGVPVSYVVKEGFVYFHCAQTGQKLDNLSHQPRASFCVVGNTQPVYDVSYTTYFESVVVFGTVQPVEEDGEKRQALMALVEKYLPAHGEHAPHAINQSWKATAVMKLSIDHITGKEKKKKD